MDSDVEESVKELVGNIVKRLTQEDCIYEDPKQTEYVEDEDQQYDCVRYVSSDRF